METGRWSALTVILVLHAVIGGCSRGEPTSRRADADDAPPLRAVSGTDLEAMVRDAERPLLVEFGVNFGCVRCDKMRPQMTRLARQFEGRVDVVRVDFEAHRDLALQCGATICPSYVLFDQAQVTVTRNFPTSADLLAADLEAALPVESVSDPQPVE